MDTDLSTWVARADVLVLLTSLQRSCLAPLMQGFLDDLLSGRRASLLPNASIVVVVSAPAACSADAFTGVRETLRLMFAECGVPLTAVLGFSKAEHLAMVDPLERVSFLERVSRAGREVALSGAISAEAMPSLSLLGPRGDPGGPWASGAQPEATGGEPAVAGLRERNAGTTLSVAALGAFQVHLDGHRLPEASWPSRKAVMLLTYLSETRGRSVAAPVLEEALWPDGQEGRQALHTAVSRIRRAFRSAVPGRGEVLLFERGAYCLHPSLVVEYDVQRFEECCSRARRLLAVQRIHDAMHLLESAIRMYRGPFLEGLGEDWVETRRRYLEHVYTEAATTLGDLWIEHGRARDAVTLLSSVVGRDPCCERAQLGLVRGLAASGDRHEAIAHYQCYTGVLQRTLGLAPGEAITEVYRSLLVPEEGCLQGPSASPVARRFGRRTFDAGKSRQEAWGG